MRANHFSLFVITLVTSAITVLMELAASAQAVQVIPLTGGLWRYNQSNNLDSVQWMDPAYDDKQPGWQEGPALLSNDTGNGGIAPLIGTLINGPRVPAEGVLQHSYYFRTRFNWSSTPEPYVTLNFVIRADDGAIIFLNGTEILRFMVDPLAPVQFASSDLANGFFCGGDADCDGLFSVTLPAGSPLLRGENVLAAIVYQEGGNSSDVTFGLQLSVTPPVAPTFTDVNQPSNRVVLQFRSSTLSVFATSIPAPTYQWFVDNQLIDGATASSLLVTNESVDTITREYYVQVSNPLGSIASRVASVLFTADSVSPVVVSVGQGGAFDTVIVTFDEVIANASAVHSFNFDVTDGINDPLGVISSTPSADGRSITLILGSAMLENTLYTANIGLDSLTDVAGNTMAPVNVQFRSWVTTGDCGGVLFERYTGLTGGNVITTLTGNPKYPNFPDIVTRLPSFAAGVGAGDNFGDNYGGRMRALFIPDATTSYIFYISADDASQLFINPNGPGPAGKVLVQQDTGCCGPYTGHATAPIPMTAGRAYYIEAIYQEGGGGDYCYVAVRKQGEAAPVGRSEVDAIPGSMLGSPAAPANVAGAVAITTQPANQTAVPNTTATFSVGTSPDALLCYQWSRDGVAILNAVNSQYSLVVQNSDNGAKFSVVVSIIAGNTVTSGEATLTVAADTIRPTVLSVAANAAGTQITVTYSEPMDPTSAASAANYTISGVAPSSVTLNGSATVATLVLAAPLATGGCTLSEVRVSGVKDTAPVGNLVNPNPTTVSLSSPFFEILALGATWKYNDSGTDLGTSWSATAFNDSAWLSGPAPLGFEPAAAQIPVVATPIAAGSATTTAYFRTHFTLGVNPATIAALQLSGVVDDGAVFYLNGVEAGRLRMPDAPAVITAATLATASGPEPVDGNHTVENISISKAALVAGDNVLAVELHPSSLTSSDSIFGASIRIVLCVPALVVQHVGSQVKLTWGDAAYRLETAPAVTGPWTSQAGASGVSVPASPNNAFFRLVNP